MYNMPMQPQQFNITSFATTMMTLGLMSSLFGGIFSGISGTTVVMPHRVSLYTINRDDIKREAIRRTGEYWSDEKYDELMRHIINRLHRYIIEEIDYFAAKYVVDEFAPPPAIKRIRRSEFEED